MDDFRGFLIANMAAQTALRAEIVGLATTPREYGLPGVANLQTKLLALTFEMNARYLREKGRIP